MKRNQKVPRALELFRHTLDEEYECTEGSGAPATRLKRNTNLQGLWSPASPLKWNIHPESYGALATVCLPLKRDKNIAGRRIKVMHVKGISLYPHLLPGYLWGEEGD